MYGISFFMIIRPDQEKNKTLCVLRAFAVQEHTDRPLRSRRQARQVRHNIMTAGKRRSQMTCTMYGISFFLIIRPDQEKK
jgi:hypothetical protein